MPKLVVNYMRPMAMFLLILLSIAILGSFLFIPKSLAFALPDFYHQYWRLLSILFVVCTLVLAVAFYAETRQSLINKWIFHVIWFGLLGGFVYVTVKIFAIGNILLAFVD